MKRVLLASASIALSVYAASYQVVSEASEANFPSLKQASDIHVPVNSPAYQVFTQGSACLIANAHYSSNTSTDRGVSTNMLLGAWNGTADMGITIRSITVSDTDVQIVAEERFLIYTNASLCSWQKFYAGDASYYGGTRLSYQYSVLNTATVGVETEQECVPPIPWNSKGIYAPSYRSQMTNVTEKIGIFPSDRVTRTILGYYDADGDGYATATKCEAVQGESGQYLDERKDGTYYAVNDVLLVKYTLPRQSYLHSFLCPEDNVRRYWQASRALYRLVFETTPLTPWWTMPEYQ